MLNEGQNERLRDLFARAMELPKEQRLAFCRSQCADDEAVRAELESLMASHETDGATFVMDATAAQVADSAPTRLGPYWILETIGEGGMGSVYLAEQREPVLRTVAIKVIRAGMASDAMLRRFEFERQSLAVMNHPCIAKIHDAGATDANQPYFVMEYVDGQPLTRYCEQHDVGLGQRLELFEQICRGVHHAHQKGLLHRDLKPGNILVTLDGEHVRPKIIDFGLARSTSGESHSLMTMAGQLVGTLEYMPPEQACGEVVDTRTDVYALGVILYELLTDELPLTAALLREDNLAETVRKIREVEPQKPSSRVVDTTAGSGRASSSRASSSMGQPRSRARELRGDLDWIVMRAIAKEPERRYSSAEALADDIRRHLNSEPVLAGPPSVGYRLRKWVRRHRASAVAAGLVLATLLVGAAATAWQWQLALGENKRFRLTRHPIDLATAIREAEDAGPGWPSNVERLQRWLVERGEPLERTRDEVEAELARLRVGAMRRRDDGSLVPDAEQLASLRRQRAAVEHAVLVNRGVRKFREPTIDDDLRELPLERLRDYAWARVAADRTVWGQEAAGLAAARHLVEQAESREVPAEQLADYVHVFALALAACGEGSKVEEPLERLRSLAVDDARLAAWSESIARQRDLLDGAPFGLLVQSLMGRIADMDRQQRGNGGWLFKDGTEQFLHDTLRSYEADLTAFCDSSGWLSRMRARLRWARALTEWERRGAADGPSWAEAAEAIRKADGVTAHAAYGEHPIDLPPQAGLVPIGMNPQTKLWEFYHLRSAWDSVAGDDPLAIEVPRHEPNGDIPIDEHSGIVFVLVPGGTCMVGAHKWRAEVPDPYATDHETPVKRTFGPFFIARHELTQAQWLRLSFEDNPSRFGPGFTARGMPTTVNAAHPVTDVAWDAADGVLARYGLLLPTEAQWEYVARAGTKQPWYTGRDPASLEGSENLCDMTRESVVPGTRSFVEWADGHAVHAPVGSFRPNPFGLFDMLGNVQEWCGDIAGYSKDPVHGPSAARLPIRVASDRDRTYRGGSARSMPIQARCAAKWQVDASTKFPEVGFRAARAILR